VLLEAFRPGGYGVADGDFWAFSNIDAPFRPWYNKIARDYYSQGRFGYAWDDGLGVPLGVRIFNNFATYKLLYWLGTRRMMAIGYLLMVFVSGWLCGWRFGLWVGALAGLLLAGSPLLAATYTHRGKPELFWWGVGTVFVVIAFSGPGLIAGLLWSFLAWANLSVSAMLVLMLGPGLVLHSLSADSVWGLAIGSIPGVAKHSLRGIYALRSGFVTSLMSEQSRVVKQRSYSRLRTLVWWLPLTLSLAVSGYESQQFISGGLILVVALVIHWANFRIIHVYDEQSFHLAFLAIGLGYAVAVQSVGGLLAILLLAYNRPAYCGIPVPVRRVGKEDQWRRRLYNAWREVKESPGVTSLELPRSAALTTFFDYLPNGARLMAESDGDPRTRSRFRAFWLWTEEFLPERQIDLVNEEWTGIIEPKLRDRYLVCFSASHMTGREMKKLCEILGVSYIVAHTSATIAALQLVGYQLVARVSLRQLKHFREVICTPPATLTLLRGPRPVTIIEPALAWERKGNILAWNAKAGCSYIIRYRYSPDFRAYQDRAVLEIEPVKPIDGLPLTFMKVKAIADGQLALKFHPHWI